MKKIDLTFGWKFIGVDHQPVPSAELKIPTSTETGWEDISVPGDVNAALVNLNKMPDPHQDDNSLKCYWVTSKDWWYKKVFDLSSTDIHAGNTDLCFNNIDGTAEVWLNNKLLGTAKNSFRKYRFNIKGLLNEKKNELCLRFHSIDALMGGKRIDDCRGWGTRRAWVRKPQFNFGWDWALPLPSIGIGGDVWLEYQNEQRLVDFSVQTFTTGRVDFGFEVTKLVKEKGYDVRVTFEGYGVNVVESITRKCFKSYLSLDIPDPRVWWPIGYGESCLYNYTVELLTGGVVVDTRKGKVGFRECNIYERPFTKSAGPGYSFEIQVNGVTVFCKGVNWVPLELWPAMATHEQAEFYLRKMRDAGLNIIRVWGGGIYEPDYFYDLCDELGIMVWQDFMFASSGYPVNYLRDEIIAEANYQIRRLRNHSSIVLWCGCNEDVYSWGYPGQQVDKQVDDTVDTTVDVHSSGVAEVTKLQRIKWDPELYTMLLRGLVSKHGLNVPYIESSPQSRDDAGNLPNSGNAHISCWKYALFTVAHDTSQFRKHFEQVCSFDSEFCIQGPCSVEAFKKFLSLSHHWPPDDVWTIHIQRGHKNLTHHEQTMLIANGIFGEVNSLEKYVKYGQAVHVEMMRAEYEAARHDRPNSGGTMVWQYNDCWPTSNWSIIDYYRTPKPSYYSAKRACMPILPIIFERRGVIDFSIGNDTLNKVVVTVEYGQETFDGVKIWNREKKVVINENSTKIVDKVARKKVEVDNDSYFYIHAMTEDGRQFEKIAFFPDGWKNIEWPAEPNIKPEIIEQKQVNNGWVTKFKIKADTFVRLCHLKVKDEDTAWWSDNYYDLPSGCEKVVEVFTGNKVGISSILIGHWLGEWY
ncbi:MAG: glycoside hydrolase family 2 protein [Elusimicrobiota bacterium]